MTLFPWFLFAHVLGAIIAFGPVFSFPIMGRLGAEERQHANFATRLSAVLSHVQVLPFAVLQGFTGVGLVVTGNIDVLRVPWLILAIVLYLVALGYAIFVQTPTIKRVIELTSGPPPGMAPGADVPVESAGGPPGPPPGLMALVRRVQLGGTFLTALIVTIVFLMVVKPTF